MSNRNGESAVQSLIDALNEKGVEPLSQPLLLSIQNVDARDVTAVKVVTHHEKGGSMESVEELFEQGYKVMAMLVVRDDPINYGDRGCSAVVHRLMVVMVKT